MEFLNKLYESNYFGIGLFAVISFLVVTFLVVLFFGKKDEKKRKLESTDVISTTNTEDLFKETSEVAPVEVPVAPIPVETPTIEPVVPVINEVKDIMPVPPVNYTEEVVQPVAPITYEEPVVPIIAPTEEIQRPVIEEVVTPIMPTVEPVRLEPTTYNVPIEPKRIEPIRINIPEEPVREERPVVTPVIEPTPRVVEPVINETYYKPVEEVKTETEEIKVPSIDFDALAKSISEELDELEKSTTKEEVKVTPINEVTARPNQFSSVYVSEPKRVEPPKVDLPKTIDLPTKKDDIEPESYNI